MTNGFNPTKHSPYLAAAHVYGIECQQFIKVGVAKDIPKRLNAIQACNPFPCRVAFKIKTVAPYHCERKMHEILRDKSVGREWFAASLDEVKLAAKEGASYARWYMQKAEREEFDVYFERSQSALQTITESLEQINAGTYSQ